ncbi:retropepsin-like aspartic protease [Caulobacter sp. 17J65-9]|uniref:retropepsin-like aspartic protease n=1 Tax=Caulobacter sp. 17J65-9 TaxID=2709382 RepID=UPI0013C76656|nr:retropepsin-like aspartic protease [Caulobacter sp. 17J65-9]NEX93362.1 clan AA aspartic protease [Caulobacter sp. 17J65-9]
MLSRRQIAMGLGLWAAAPSIGVSQDFVPPAGSPDPQDDPGLETGTDQALRMTGPVRVNDRGPFNFVVDTGANRSVIAEERAAELGLPPAGLVSLHGIGGVETVPTVLVDRFEVGALTTRALRMPVLPRRRLGVDGLIGLDALDKRLVEMDFRRGRLRLARSRPKTVGVSRLTQGVERPGLSVAARYRFGQLTVVDARSGTTNLTAFIDSGSQVTVGNSALRDVVRLRQLDIPDLNRVVPIFSVTSQTAYGEFAVLRSLRLGETRLVNLPLVFSDLHTFGLWGLNDSPALLLGIDTLSLFGSVTLDFGRHEVLFNP